MATIVNWYFWKHNPAVVELPLDTLIDMTPVRVLSTVLKDPDRSYNMNAEAETGYGKCPAFLDYLKNVYAICAPYDIELNIEPDGRITNVITPSSVSAAAVHFRSSPSPDTNVLISLQFQYVFYSDESVMVEQLPPFMDYTLMEQGVTVIPGTFDISKWVRPVEGAYEIRKGVRNVRIKAGTPLTYVRFVAADGGDIRLKKVEETPQHQKVVDACVGLKTVRKGSSLAKCYELADKLVSKLVRSKRCPFKFGKK